MESTSYLGSDMIYEILTHSSMETVGRCRLLSKECNSLTYESSFTRNHSQKTNTVSGYFLQSMYRSRFYSFFASSDSSSYLNFKLSLDFLPDRVEIKASTKQGILLCQTHDRIPRYYVCKPTMKEWQRIPNPKTRYLTLAMGMIVIRSKPLSYKIVRFSQPISRLSDEDFYRYSCHRCELFDSRIWSWKQLEEVKLPGEETFSFRPDVSVRGSLHWLTRETKKVFAFDVNRESYSKFSLPPTLYDGKEKCIELMEYEGKLAVTSTDYEESFVELWVMENYDKKEWSKKHTLSIEALRRKHPYTSPLSFCNSDVVLMKDNDMCVTFFNFLTGSKHSVWSQECLDILRCFPFGSDFEPSNLRRDFAHPSNKRVVNQREESFGLQSGFPLFFPQFSPTFLVIAMLLAFSFFLFVLRYIGARSHYYCNAGFYCFLL